MCQCAEKLQRRGTSGIVDIDYVGGSGIHRRCEVKKQDLKIFSWKDERCGVRKWHLSVLGNLFHQFRKLLQHLSRCQRKFTGTLIQPVDQGGILFQQGRYLPIVGQKLS